MICSLIIIVRQTYKHTICTQLAESIWCWSYGHVSKVTIWNWTAYISSAPPRGNYLILSQMPFTSYSSSSRGGVMWNLSCPHWHGRWYCHNVNFDKITLLLRRVHGCRESVYFWGLEFHSISPVVQFGLDIAIYLRVSLNSSQSQYSNADRFLFLFRANIWAPIDPHFY